jgi:hypothetical protein
MNLTMNDIVGETRTTTASTQPTERHDFFHKLIQPLKTAKHPFKICQKRDIRNVSFTAYLSYKCNHASQYFDYCTE